jgi:hypothetical protein
MTHPWMTFWLVVIVITVLDNIVVNITNLLHRE